MTLPRLLGDQVGQGQRLGRGNRIEVVFSQPEFEPIAIAPPRRLNKSTYKIIS